MAEKYSSVQDMVAGDYVKLESGQTLKIASVYGVSSEGHVAPPSKGGFGVVTESGRRVSMWEVSRYLKADEVEKEDKR